VTRPAPAPLTGTPTVGRWDFGGFPYGLEPLVLPPVADRGAPHGPPDALHAAGWRLVRAAADGPGPEGDVDDDDARTRLFWFRWVTGHQVTFAVWRLMGRLLDDVAAGRVHGAAASAPLCAYVRVCSAMLLYSGSCPPAVYESTIRPAMWRWHRGFSGSWAPDYPVVRDVFRGRPAPGADAGELRAAVRVHALAHDGIAARLVPDGRSLLNQASLRGLDSGLTALLYDSFFVTSRAPVSRSDTVAQLLRRLVAIAGDLAANGVHPLADDDPLPAELRRTDVSACADGLPDILVQTARAAGGEAQNGTEARRQGLGRATAEVTRT
jgi:hypothetical protein